MGDEKDKKYCFLLIYLYLKFGWVISEKAVRLGVRFL